MVTLRQLPALGVAALVVAVSGAALPDYGVIEGSRWTVFAAGALVACLLAVTCQGSWKPDILDYAVSAFAGYAFASAAWSPDTAQALHEGTHGVLALALFLAARRWPERAWGLVPVAAVIAVTVIFATDLARPDWRAGFGNDNKATETIVVLLLLAAGLRWRDWLLPFYALAGLWLFLNDSHMELVGFGAVAVCLFWRMMRGREQASGDAVILGAVALVVVALCLNDHLKVSLSFRMEMIATSFAAWLSAPTVGHGLGSFAFVYPAHMALPLTALSKPMTLIEAAHFEPLQVLVEFGAIGLALVAVAAVTFVRRANVVPGYAGALAALAGMSLVSYPLHEPATLALACLIAARLTSVPVAERRRTAWRLGALSPLFVLIVAAAVPLPGAIYAERQHAFAENARASELTKTEIARRAFAFELDAYRAYPYRNLERIRLFPALVAWLEHGGAAPEREAERLFNISRSASPRSSPVMLSRLRYQQRKKEIDR